MSPVIQLLPNAAHVVTSFILLQRVFTETGNPLLLLHLGNCIFKEEIVSVSGFKLTLRTRKCKYQRVLCPSYKYTRTAYGHSWALVTKGKLAIPNEPEGVHFSETEAEKL